MYLQHECLRVLSHPYAAISTSDILRWYKLKIKMFLIRLIIHLFDIWHLRFIYQNVPRKVTEGGCKMLIETCCSCHPRLNLGIDFTSELSRFIKFWYKHWYVRQSCSASLKNECFFHIWRINSLIYEMLYGNKGYRWAIGQPSTITTDVPGLWPLILQKKSWLPSSCSYDGLAPKLTNKNYHIFKNYNIFSISLNILGFLFFCLTLFL